MEEGLSGHDLVLLGFAAELPNPSKALLAYQKETERGDSELLLFGAVETASAGRMLLVIPPARVEPSRCMLPHAAYEHPCIPSRFLGRVSAL